MKYELFIGLRYLQARRQETFISLITVISVLGVMIGVMTLNVVMAVMTGFEETLARPSAWNQCSYSLGKVREIHCATMRDCSSKWLSEDGVVAATPTIYGRDAHLRFARLRCCGARRRSQSGQ